MDKQEQLQKLMNDIMSEELRQIYEQMEELMQEMDPEKLQEQLENMEMSHDAMERSWTVPLNSSVNWNGKPRWTRPSTI